MRETADPRLNPVVNFLIAGGASAAGRAFVNDLSVVKMMAQAGTPGGNMGAFQAYKSLWQHYGLVKGFFKGTAPAVARIFPYAGIQFLTYDALVRNFSGRKPGVIYREQPQILSLAVVAVAGGIAGSLAQIVTHPLDVIKVRMSLQSPLPNEILYKSTQSCFAKILEKEGLAGLYKAFPISVVGAGVFSGTMFLLWDIGDNLPWRRIEGRPVFAVGPIDVEWLALPVAAAAAANVASHPFDLIRKKMMAYTPEAKLTDFEVPNSTWECIKRTYKFNGLPGFFQGIVANAAKPAFQIPVVLLTMWIAQMVFGGGKKPKKFIESGKTKIFEHEPI